MLFWRYRLFAALVNILIEIEQKNSKRRKANIVQHERSIGSVMFNL